MTDADRWTYMTKLILVSRNFANAPKKCFLHSFPYLFHSKFWHPHENGSLCGRHSWIVVVADKRLRAADMETEHALDWSHVLYA